MAIYWPDNDKAHTHSRTTYDKWNPSAPFIQPDLRRYRTKCQDKTTYTWRKKWCALGCESSLLEDYWGKVENNINLNNGDYQISQVPKVKQL